MRLRAILPTILGLFLIGLAMVSPAEARVIDPQVCIAPLAAKTGDPEVFHCSPAQTKLGRGDFLADLGFAPIASIAGDPMVLRLVSLWQDSMRVHFRYADGAETIDVIDTHNGSHGLTIGAVFELPVPTRAAALTGIRIEVRNSANLRGVVVRPRIMSLDEAYHIKLALVAVYAAFAGLALALVAYNYSLWRALRNGFQLDYCLMVGTLGAYAFTSSGALGLLLPALANNDRLRVNYVLLALSAVTALRFVHNFYSRRTFPARLHRAIPVASWAPIIGAIAFAALVPWQIWWLDKLYFVAMSVLLAVGATLLGYALVRRAPYARLFVLAWSAPFVISALRASYGFGLVPYSLLLDNGSLIAMGIESLLSSLMVSARIRHLASERDTAVEGEQNARRLADIDPLTGLLNRRSFLDRAIGRRLHQRLLLIDIDHFKSVNDRLGHEAGDRVLALVAEEIELCRPDSSLAVRLGGEEFAILMPRKLADDCMPQKVLDAVRSRAMPRGITVTVSIGISEGRIGSEDDWNRLYRLADSALYRAKSDGRDRACKATDFRDAA